MRFQTRLLNGKPIWPLLATEGGDIYVRARDIARDFGVHLERLTRKHNKFVAVAFSLGLHLLFVLFLLMRQPAGVSGGGYNGEGTSPGDGMAVTLVNGEDLNRMILTVKAPAPDTPENTIVALQVAPVPAPLELTQTELVPQLVSDPPSLDQSDQEEGQKAARAGSEGDGGAGTSGDDLWGAIAPCWNRLADSHTLPVTLEVSFSTDGNIASPPVIDADPAQQSDPNVQRSETIAMQALAQCGAYAMAEGKADVKVNFPRP